MCRHILDAVVRHVTRRDAEIPGGVAFASEPQALLAAGLVRPRVRREARTELLQMQVTTGAETIFEGSVGFVRRIAALRTAG